jgi:hypothetical protein
MRALLLIPLLASAGAHAARTKPLSPAELKQYQTCEDTSNCIRVTNGCCDCANGGDTTAVSRAFDKKFERLFSCGTTMCTQKAGECNFREPVCVQGYCKLGPNKDRFPKDKKAGPLPRIQPSVQ